MTTTKVSELKPVLNDLLSQLSFNIYVSEHRLRYQQEQKNRFYGSYNKFQTSVYLWRGRTIENFIYDYNKFIQHEIKKSHQYLSPKIEANYRRNYHDGETFPVTSLIFYLYFKTDKVKRFFAKLLTAAYRNPYSETQRNII